jgi:hypothetical protein
MEWAGVNMRQRCTTGKLNVSGPIHGRVVKPKSTAGQVGWSSKGVYRGGKRL